MSIKAARGTKRLCENCENKFYDLNRDPIVCPICGTVFEQKGGISAVDHIAESDDEDDIIDVPAGAELVSLDEVDESESKDIPALEDEENLADLDDDADIPDATDDDTFLEDEDDGDTDVTGIIGGGSAPISSDGDES